MAPFDLSVTSVCESETKDLPTSLNQFALISTWARKTGLLDEMTSRLRLDRNSGYQGIDVVLFVLAFLSAQQKSDSFGRFARRTAEVGDELAGLGGRASWPAQASVSRALGCAVDSNVSDFSTYLLCEAVDMSQLLSHEASMSFDASGKPWHVFDFDPTRQVSRERALPESDELPAAERTGRRLGEPGYTGRKRGSVVVSRPTLQHRGSRLWCGVDLHGGSGHWAESVARGFADLQRLAKAQGLELDRSILCIDGEQGGWTQVRAGLASPARFVTRLNVYSLLEKTRVNKVLDLLDWVEVGDALSGPTRWASDFGVFEVDERPVRLVVTRYKATESKRGTGKVIGGWHYEIFATDVSRQAWPAADLVELYHERGGQENYFALEDREIELDRCFSDHPPGQLLCWTVGLWLWNIQLFLGWQTLKEHPERPDVPVERPPKDATEESGWAESAFEQPDSHAVIDKPASAQAPCDDYWSQRLAHRAGWGWDASVQRPVCPAGYRLGFHGTRPSSSGDLEVRFRASKAQCHNCEHRTGCTTSTRKTFRKEVSLNAPQHAVMKIGLKASQEPVKATVVDTRWTPPVGPTPSGRWHPRPAVLKPQKLRHRFIELCRRTKVRVDIDHVPRTPTPAIYVTSRADRQRRRHTWKQRNDWNRLRPKDRIDIDICAELPLRALLTDAAPPAQDASVG